MRESWKPIVLSAKVFGHLSQGLYRTPAGAIKELISNAYDADATLVRIHTGFPRFQTFSCEDDGTGMSRIEFERLMNRGIGSSFKRVSSDFAVTAGHHRPLIGRLGLGILALAQICSRFEITSHHAQTKEAFRATIRFPAYTRQEMDKIAAKARNSNDDVEVHGGQYTIQEEPFDQDKRGVRVFTEYLRETFRKRMITTLDRPGHSQKSRIKEPYRDFAHFLNGIYSQPDPVASLNLLSDYDQLLFGLAVAPPLPLTEDRNIATELPMIRARQKRLRSFEFEVQVDNLALANPVWLPWDRDGHLASQCRLAGSESEAFVLHDGPVKESRTVVKRNVNVANSDLRFHLYEVRYENKDVAGTPLAFDGYLFQQTGRLYPRDIQGVLVRINDVAIGRYDSGMLTYPYAEGPRYSMVSSELFIHRGFEDALNIDRDSFNELHPHYMRLQAYVHGLLQQLVFPETWGEEKERNKARRTVAAKKREDNFVTRYSETTGEKLRSIQRIERRPPRPVAPMQHTPVEFEADRSGITIDRTHPLVQALFRRRKYAPLVEKLLVAFERANLEPSAARRREVYYKLLVEIFADL